MIHNLRIVNTFFKHKPIHLTTWESPINTQNITDAKTNTPRRNPYRNQIDYILVRNNVNTRTLDAKASISKVTKSDHKPVIAKIIIKWKYQPMKKNTNKRFNVTNFDRIEIRNDYKNEIVASLTNVNNQPVDNQFKWDNIVRTLKQAASNTIGFISKPKQHGNIEIQQLSNLQRKIQLQMQSYPNNDPA